MRVKHWAGGVRVPVLTHPMLELLPLCRQRSETLPTPHDPRHLD
jgi:hypothetical protein